ncbi:GNAT family N-acetyltransferase [Paenibacillus sp. CC-CFT747]|nr:GNAT family N-acetyltransferase [Paenibacillus sp. CC-CFT747]
MVTIRKYVSRDLDEITELMTDLGHAASKEQMQKRLEAISSIPQYRTFVAEREGKIAGMIGLRLLYSYEEDDPVVQISAMVTKTEYRGQGIGRALLRQGEKWAGEIGAKAMVLTSGNRPEREHAHEFYKQLGYMVSGFRFSKRL